MILFAATYPVKVGTKLNVFQCNDPYRKNKMLSVFIVKMYFCEVITVTASVAIYPVQVAALITSGSRKQ